MERPWGAISAIQTIVDTVVMGPTSVIQRVKNSDHFQRLFQQSISQNPENVELSHISNCIASISSLNVETCRTPSIVVTLPCGL
eukprot:4648438-Pyramimonas_sp.AAC.1